MSEARYDVLTWDPAVGIYTPQEGLESPSLNIPLWGVRRALRELQESFGYSCHRNRWNNDPSVLVERVDDDELELALDESAEAKT